MSRVVKNNLPFLHLLTCFPEHQRQFLLDTATPEQMHALVQIVFNILHGNIPVSKEVKRNLKKHVVSLNQVFLTRKRSKSLLKKGEDLFKIC